MSEKNFPNDNKKEDGIEFISLDNKEEDSVNAESSSSVETKETNEASNETSNEAQTEASSKEDKKPLPKKELIRYVILAICAIVFIVSATILINYFVTQHREKQKYKELESNAISHQDKSTEYVDEESSEYVFNISNEVDFEYLKSINDEVRGWISFPLLGIEYPFVQGADNDFYLTHAYNKEAAHGGAIYMEQRLDPEFKDSHMILYGHNMSALDGSMFSKLLKYDDEDFYLDNKGEHFVYIYLPDNTVRIYEVFSVTDVNSEEHAPLFYVDLNSIAEYANYASSLELYDTGIDVTDDDQILTLFTCQYGGENKERHMVHCKLITVVEN